MSAVEQQFFCVEAVCFARGSTPATVPTYGLGNWTWSEILNLDLQPRSAGENKHHLFLHVTFLAWSRDPVTDLEHRSVQERDRDRERGGGPYHPANSSQDAILKL